jgi:hypothetical protein
MKPSAGAVDPQLAKNVSNFRVSSLANGYRPIRVRSASKLPVAKRWQLGETEDQLLAVEATALNTGILAAGLRCVDMDVDASDAAQQIVGAVCRHLPENALIRRRGNSNRLAFIYRAANGQPGKRSVTGLNGKVEVLGAGQQLVVDGVHPAGDTYYFKNGRGPNKILSDQDVAGLHIIGANDWGLSLLRAVGNTPAQPGVSAPAYPHAMIRDALKAIDSANPPLSPSKQAKGRYAADAIAQAIAHHRGGKASDVEAEGLLGYVQSAGFAVVQYVKVPRPGSRADSRKGLVVTPEGKAAMQAPDPAGVSPTKPPQSPQSSRGNDAGKGDSGSPKGPRNVPGGCGGNAGTKIAGQAAEAHPTKTAPQAPGAASGAESPLASVTSVESSADSPAATRAIPNADAGTLPEAPTAPAQATIHDEDTGAAPPLAPESGEPAAPVIAPGRGKPADDLSIPDFLLRRPLPGPAAADTAPKGESK